MEQQDGQTQAMAAVATVVLIVGGGLFARAGKALDWVCAAAAWVAALMLVWWLIGQWRALARRRREERADAVAEQVAEIATWCEELTALRRDGSVPLSTAADARIDAALRDADAVLKQWRGRPAGGHLRRIEPMTVRVLPALRATHRRLRNELTIRGGAR